MQNTQTLTIKIYSSVGISYQGQLKSLTSVNEKGKFDVLPLHSNFISIIKDTLILEELSGKIREIPVKTAVLKVRENLVSVFIGIEGLG